MANVKTLSVALRANTGAFSRGMKKAQWRLKKFKASVGGAMSSLMKFGPIAGLVGTAGMGVLLKRTMDNIDSMAKFGRTVGISNAELQGFQLAAEKGGASAETMQKGITKMLKNISDAGRGLSTPRDAIADLGLELEDLNRMKTSDKFLTIAESISKIGDKAKQVQVAQDIFGRAGSQLIETMSGGAEGLKQNLDLVKKLGIGFSELDSAKVEVANDRMTELGYVFDSIIQKLSIELAPFIGVVANALTDMAAKGAFSFKNLAKFIMPVVDWGLVLLRVFKGVMAVLKMLVGIASTLSSIVFQALGRVLQIGEAIKNLVTFDWNNSLDNFALKLSSSSKDMAVDAFGGAGDNLAEAFGDEFSDGIRKKMKSFSEAFQSESESIAKRAKKGFQKGFGSGADEAAGGVEMAGGAGAGGAGGKGAQRAGVFNFARVSTDALAGQITIQQKQLAAQKEQVQESKKLNLTMTGLLRALQRNPLPVLG